MTNCMIDDGTLLAFLDDALDRDDRRQVEGHLDACSGCLERLERIEGRANTLSALLEATDSRLPTTPSGRPDSRRRLTAAAAIVLASTLLLTPLGAMLVDGIRSLVPTEAVIEAPQPVPSAGALAFSAVGVLEVRLERSQEGAYLVLSRTNFDQVTVRSSADATEFTVAPNELRISRPDGEAADIEMAVPSYVSRVVVYVGSRELRTVPATAIGSEPLRVALF